MKLELKHLAPYLPYNLKLTKEDWGKIGVLVPFIKNDFKGLQIEIDYALNTKAKPILRPISDLLDECKEYFKKVKRNSLWMDCNNSSYSDFAIECEELINNTGCISVSVNFRCNNELISLGFFYNDYQWLIENHFDIFGLIQDGLAIDINDVSVLY